MKKILFLMLLMTLSMSAFARRVENYKCYQVKVESIAVGYYEHIGVKLEGVDNIVILLNDNPHQKNILALLMTAKSTNQIVNIYVTGTEAVTGHNYIILEEATLGDWPIWRKS